MISDAHAAEVLERAPWSLGHDRLFDELTRLVGLSFEETAALASLHATAEWVAPALTESFDARLAALSTHGRLERFDRPRMHRVTGQWFLHLFSGLYDETYVKRRLAMGLLLATSGLPIRYPLAILDLTGELGEWVAAHGEHPETALRAFRKVLSLDVAVFTQAYEGTRRAG